ncbi:hypothetical protein C8Q79DRAFT_929293 [Trametes meyenii]|nr:hypothetical protein C8Q79DRAFT_929293 [Trametes meyenii]
MHHTDTGSPLDQTTSPIPLSDLPLTDWSENNPPAAEENHESIYGQPSKPPTSWRTPSLGTPSIASVAAGYGRGSSSFIPAEPEWRETLGAPGGVPPYIPVRTTRRDDPNDSGGATIQLGPSLASTGPNGAWSNCVKALREHDQHIIQGWKEDVDSLLVFTCKAGLFSAAVTAFNIESYKLLQEDPDEKTADILGKIYAQLATGNAGYTLKPPSDNDVFRPDARLVVSLVSASIGILTKQWLREYTRSAASSPRENARIRQLRHEGFTAWKIPLTIALLPVLLQIALALFFAGLLDLLWSLNTSVAGVITVIVTLSLSFLVITTVMPTFRGDCPYKSPQALGVYLLVQGMTRILSLFAFKVYTWLGWGRPKWPLVIDPALFSHGRRVIATWLLSLIHRRFFTNWREREMAIVHDSAARLDQRVLADADATFMEDDFLCRTISFCLNDTECRAAVECLHEIIAHRADLILEGVPHWRHREAVDSGVNLLLHLILDALPRMDRGDHPGIAKMLGFADSICRVIPFETGHYDTVTLYQRLFDVLASFLTYEQPVKICSFGVMQRMWARSNAYVRPVVIQRLILFARSARQANEPATFHVACEMALAFSTTGTFPAMALDSVKNELRHLLADLETYLTVPHPSGVDAPGSGQTASILLALEALDERDPSLISSPTLRGFLNSVKARGSGSVETENVSSFWRKRLEYTRQLREYRERHPMATIGRRRTATANKANTLGLDLQKAMGHRSDGGRTPSPGVATRPVSLRCETDQRPHTPPEGLGGVSPHSQTLASGSIRSTALQSLGLNVHPMHTPSL